jgi:PAS domain S-box-containing protein
VSFLARDRGARASVGESEQRFRTVFTEAPVGMLVLDAAGVILRVNAAFCN